MNCLNNKKKSFTTKQRNFPSSEIDQSPPVPLSYLSVFSSFSSRRRALPEGRFPTITVRRQQSKLCRRPTRRVPKVGEWRAPKTSDHSLFPTSALLTQATGTSCGISLPAYSRPDISHSCPSRKQQIAKRICSRRALLELPTRFRATVVNGSHRTERRKGGTSSKGCSGNAETSKKKWEGASDIHEEMWGAVFDASSSQLQTRLTRTSGKSEEEESSGYALHKPQHQKCPTVKTEETDRSK